MKFLLLIKLIIAVITTRSLTHALQQQEEEDQEVRVSQLFNTQLFSQQQEDVVSLKQQVVINEMFDQQQEEEQKVRVSQLFNTPHFSQQQQEEEEEQQHQGQVRKRLLLRQDVRPRGVSGKKRPRRNSSVVNANKKKKNQSIRLDMKPPSGERSVQYFTYSLFLLLYATMRVA